MMKRLFTALLVLLSLNFVVSELQSQTIINPSSGGSTANLPAPYLGQVGTRSMLAVNTNAGFTVGMTRTTHYMRDNCTNPTVIYPNWYMSSGSTEANTGSGTYKAGFEYPAGTVTLSNENILNGNNAINAPPGNVAFTFNVTIPKGAMFFMRVNQTQAGGIYWTQLSGGVDSAYGSVPTDGMEIGTTANDKVMSGTVGFANGISYFPVAILCQTRQPSVIAFGDSREVGDYINDISYDVGMTTSIIGRTYGYTLAAISGTLQSQWNSGTHTFLNQLIAAGYWSHATNNYGVNDVPSQTAAVVTTSRQTMATNLKAQYPSLVLIGHTLYPYVGTTDILTTKAGQTIGVNQQRIFTLNSNIRLGVPGEDFSWDASDGMDTLREGKYPVSWDPSATARTPTVMNGQIAGSTLTVNSITSGPGIAPNDPIIDPAQPVQGAVMNGTYVVQQLTGTTGQAGTYQLNRQYNGSGTYPKPNVSARSLSTAGTMSDDGLHATYFGRQFIARNQGAALLNLLRR